VEQALPLEAVLEAGDAAIAHARATLRKARAIHAATVALHVECRQRRARYRSARSDSAIVIDLIVGRSRCEACLARETALSAERITAVLFEVARHYVITRTDAPCDDCLIKTAVYRLG
jgi:hypothetical protein